MGWYQRDEIAARTAPLPSNAPGQQGRVADRVPRECVRGRGGRVRRHAATPDPAYGVCEVGRGQIVQEEAICCKTPHTEVTSLTLYFDSGDPAVREDFMGLIMLIGAPLTHLGIQMLHSQGTVPDVGELLDWCRDLETLDVRDFTGVTKSFIAAYREYDLIVSKVQCNFDDVPLSARELSDPSSPSPADSATCHSASTRHTATKMFDSSPRQRSPRCSRLILPLSAWRKKSRAAFIAVLPH
jgi:hypothetical protein